MSMLLYSKTSTSAVFVWPALALNFDDGFWIELAWIGFGIGMCISRGREQ